MDHPANRADSCTTCRDDDDMPSCTDGKATSAHHHVRQPFTDGVVDDGSRRFLPIVRGHAVGLMRTVLPPAWREQRLRERGQTAHAFAARAGRNEQTVGAARRGRTTTPRPRRWIGSALASDGMRTGGGEEA